MIEYGVNMKKDRIISSLNNPSFDEVTRGMKIPESFERASYIISRLKAGKPVHETRGRPMGKIEIDGETRTAQEWSELSFEKYGERGARPETIYARMRMGKKGYALILPTDDKINMGRKVAAYQRGLDDLE